MEPINISNEVFTGAAGSKSLIDLEIPKNFNNKLIIFVHGFMGYKDWGCWNLMQSFFVSQGYGFCKYTVSHNGGTIEEPIDFHDLEAFAQNNYSKEVEDLQCALNWVEGKFPTLPEIYIVGHSRGGGIALLSAGDSRIKRIVTLAAIDSIEKRFPTGKQLEVWKTQGTRYTLNSRTNQKMPNSFSQYEDFDTHREQLDIEKACLNSTKPTLVIHGDMDTSVEIEEGRNIDKWLKTRLFEIEEGEHTFGASQPWLEKEMPEHLQKVCALMIGFFEINY
jgi:pimeloyl-ACP methyl ester carboxylesterase